MSSNGGCIVAAIIVILLILFSGRMPLAVLLVIPAAAYFASGAGGITYKGGGGKLNRILLDDSPEAEYKPRSELRPLLHWGQRKLLLSEIEFLTKFGNEADTVVYIGSAPGTHIKYLLELFPHKFILWDPREFDIEPGPRIEIHRKFFTDDAAAIYRGKDILMIGDIRSLGTEKDYHKADEIIYKDMEMQMNWHKIMKPKHSMLKFRLPYFSPAKEYLDGDIYLQVWAPIASTETRLMVGRDAAMKTYNCNKYNNQMYYFNTQTRPDYYDHQVTRENVGKLAHGYDHCYDCAAEIHILGEYLKSVGKSPDARTIAEMGAHISKMLSHGQKSLYQPPHGMYADLPQDDRMRRLSAHVEKYKLSKKKKFGYDLAKYVTDR